MPIIQPGSRPPVEVVIFGGGIAEATLAVLCARSHLQVEIHIPPEIDDGLGELTALQAVNLQYVRQLQPAVAVERYAKLMKVATRFMLNEAVSVGVTARELPTMVIAKDGHRGAWLQREAALVRSFGERPCFVDQPGLPFATRPALMLPGQHLIDEAAYRTALYAAATEAGAQVVAESTPVRLDRRHWVISTNPGGQRRTYARRIVVADAVRLPGARPSFSRGTRTWEDLVCVRTDRPLTALSYFVDDGVVAVPGPQAGTMMLAGRHSRRHVDWLANWASAHWDQVEVLGRDQRRVWVSPDGLPAVGSAGLFAPQVLTIGALGRWSALTGTAAAIQLAKVLAKTSRLLPWSPLHSRGTAKSLVNFTLDRVGLPELGRRLVSRRFEVHSPLG